MTVYFMNQKLAMSAYYLETKNTLPKGKAYIIENCYLYIYMYIMSRREKCYEEK